MSLTSRVLFPGAGWWLLLLVPLVFFGFLPSYFAKPYAGTSTLLHVHSVLMIAWVLMVIVQPLLILYKKTRLHKLLGKVSYLLMPLLLVSGWFVIRNAYATQISRRTEALAAAPKAAETAEMVSAVNENIYTPVVFIFWLGLFFGLAVFYRKRVLHHATFMFAAALTLLGPSLDRIIFQIYHLYNRDFDFFAEYAVFILIVLLLLGVLFTQWRNRYSLKPVLLTLAIYLAGIAGWELLPGTPAYNAFISLIL